MMNSSSQLRLLVTYFEPFGARSVNASADAASHFRFFADVISLPVRHRDCWTVLETALRTHNYQWVISFDEGGDQVKVETQARNIFYDNTELSAPTKLVSGGPEVVELRSPAPDFLDTLLCAGVPALCSSDAGRFCCNEVAYRSTLCTLVTANTFVHVPPDCDFASRAGAAFAAKVYQQFFML